MSPEKLVTMANQIARFMASKPQAQGIEGFAAHVNDFWEPRMRRQFLALLDAGGPGLHPIAVAARPLVRVPQDA
jgi:formate dehydrogenase subunit delta